MQDSSQIRDFDYAVNDEAGTVFGKVSQAPRYEMRSTADAGCFPDRVRSVRYGALMSSDDLIDPTGPCPLCGEPFGDEALNVDHVFGEAFGGRAKVTTHWKCNNDLGKGAEGRVHRPTSIMSLFKAHHGLSTQPMRGELADGTKIDANLAGRSWAPSKPTVSRIVNPDGSIQLNARATEQQMPGIVKNWQSKWPQVPAYEDLSSSQRLEVSIEPEMVQMNLVIELDDHLEVLKKVALGAGVLAFGSEFARSPLAASIRVADLGGDKMYLEGLTKVWEIATTTLEQLKADGAAVDDLPDPMPAPKHQVVFVPMLHDHRTVVIVHILGYPLLPWGLVVDGDLPAGRYGMRTFPVMVREDVGPYVVYDLQDLVMDATTALALAPLDDD